MEKQCIEELIRPHVYSTLSRKRNIAMIAFIEVAPGCFMYDMDFQNLIKDQKLEAEKNLSENLNLVKSNIRYSVQKD